MAGSYKGMTFRTPYKKWKPLLAKMKIGDSITIEDESYKRTVSHCAKRIGIKVSMLTDRTNRTVTLRRIV